MLEKIDNYTVTVDSKGRVPIPYGMLKRCKWLKTHEVIAIKRRRNNTWQIVLKPGKKLNDKGRTQNNNTCNVTIL